MEKVEKELTKKYINDWFRLPSKGGLTMTNLRKKAMEYDILHPAKIKKSDLKLLFLEKINGKYESDTDEDVENTKVENENNEVENTEDIENNEVENTEDIENNEVENTEVENEDTEVENKDTEEVENICTPQLVNKWFSTISNGGLNVKELRNKAIEFNLPVTDTSKRAYIKKLMLQLAYTNTTKIKSKEQEITNINTDNKRCIYISMRIATNGEKCKNSAKKGTNYCIKHIKSKQAIENKDNVIDHKVIRNSDLKVWMLDGTNSVIESPNNKIIIGYISFDEDTPYIIKMK